MTPIAFVLILFACSIAAGIIGSLLGLGGGIIVVPTLTLLMGVDIRYAIAASIVAVIATSCGAGASYVKEGICNVRLGMWLEPGTTLGGITGALLAGVIPGRALFVIFGLLLLYASYSMLTKKRDRAASLKRTDALADRLELHGTYYDRSEKFQMDYRISRTRTGLATSFLAGITSGLLGIGGGTVKVPVMNIIMGAPLKVAVATSNFMIGVTAAASASLYFARGDINPFVVAPVAAGILLGATLGSSVLTRVNNKILRNSFAILLVVVAAQMVYKGLK